MGPLRVRVLASVLVLAAGCALPGSGPAQPGPGQVGEPQTSRSLTAIVRVEPGSIAARGLRESGVALYLSRRLFNAELALLDDQAVPRPYLAEALPELNSEHWQVFPDGRMQTTHRLKPDLVWHDGAALHAEDFVFGWRVYSNPAISARGIPFSIMEEVQAADARTIVIRWSQLYPDAGSLSERGNEFPPLPRHLLQEALDSGDPDAVVNHPYWTAGHVGLGPYRLERWEPGAFIEAVAFDRHVLGRARIPRIKLIWSENSSRVLASLLAGEAQLSADTSLRVSEVPTFLRQVGPAGGSAILHPNQWRSVAFQLRPEYATPRALTDPRVRKALAYAVDKEPINEAVYDGQSIIAHAMIFPSSRTGRAVDAAITKYTFDLRQSEQLMTQAGYRRGPDGAWVSPTEGRFVSEIKTNAAADNESEMSALADGWRRAGFDLRDAVLPAALAQDNEARSTFSGLFSFNTGAGDSAAINLTSNRIPRPDNRWQGGNRGGWSHPEYDRLASAYATTLDTRERTRLMVEMVRIYAEELPTIPLFFRTQPWVFLAGLTGPQLVASESNMAWNIHEWEHR